MCWIPASSSTELQPLVVLSAAAGCYHTGVLVPLITPNLPHNQYLDIREKAKCRDFDGMEISKVKVKIRHVLVPV